MMLLYSFLFSVVEELNEYQLKIAKCQLVVDNCHVVNFCSGFLPLEQSL